MTFNKKTLNYRFPLWLTVIFFTLFSVPLLIVYDNLTIAKFAGVITVVLTAIAIRHWSYVARKNTGVIDKVPLTKNDFFDLKRVFPYFGQLNNSEVNMFKDKIGLVLSKVRFIDENGEHLSKLASIQLALFIVIIDLKKPIIINNYLIIESTLVPKISFDQNQTIIHYPLSQLLTEKVLYNLGFEELINQDSILKLEQVLRNSC